LSFNPLPFSHSVTAAGGRPDTDGADAHGAIGRSRAATATTLILFSGSLHQKT
jgi:hypothetical protein